MKNTNLLIPAIMLVFFVLCLGCSRNTAFEAYHQIPEAGWHQNDPAVFDITLSDTLQAYDLQFHIRHNVDYQYRNLWVFTDIEYPNGTSTRDTIEFIIGDKNGNWLGDGLGKIKEDHILLSNNIRFQQAGNYKFSFYQAMREEDQILENMQSIGFSILKHQ